MQKCWSLYNKAEKLRIDDLRVDQVKTILLAIPTRQIGNWYACQEGDLHWQSLSDVPDFYEEAREFKGEGLPATPSAPEAVRPMPKRRPLFEEASPEYLEAETTLQLESVPTKERRTARRFVRNLKFEVIHGGKKFSCPTQDVSMSGISLKEKLPNGLPKNFRAELSLNGTNVRFLANRVTDNTLKILEADGWDVLRNWIVNW